MVDGITHGEPGSMRQAWTIIILLLLPAAGGAQQPTGSKASDVEKKEASGDAVLRSKDRVEGYASLKEVIECFKAVNDNRNIID